MTPLIPLYAIGVFLSFTLSQTGMARRWWKSGHLEPGEEVKERGSTLRYDSGWRTKMVINGFGAVMTAVVALVFAVTKFRDGAWIVLILIPVLVLVFSAPSTATTASWPQSLSLGRLRRAAAHPPPSGDPADQRRPSRLAGGAVATRECSRTM